MNYTYIKDFHKSRQKRIGASDIPFLIPHPVRQIESLAAWTDDKNVRHANTAIDLYNEKINGKDYESSFPAEMGHYLEGRILYEFIKDNISYDIAKDFFRGYAKYKLERDFTNDFVSPEPYNNTPFKHHTEASNDFGVAHGDCVYDCNDGPIDFINHKIIKKDKDYFININGLEINLSRSFLLEAKSARYFSARRKDDPYRGYDLTLKEWQGVPLKVYFQCQYQMLLYGVDICYIALIYDTSSKHYWTIKANKKHQAELQQIAEYMKKCIDTKTPPKQLLMNSKDIKYLYPEIKDDFRELKDEELQEVLKIAIEQKEAAKQEKTWKQKKEECEEKAGIFLRDTEFIKGNVGGHLIDIAKWKKTGGSERIAGLAAIGKREDGKTIEKYLRRKKLINKTKENTKAAIVIKSKELEGIDVKEINKET